MAKGDKVKVINKDGAFGFFGFLTWIGALVYFVGQVDGFWNIVVAILKACVWPAIIIHRVLTLLSI
jgi:hypothetical protein